MVLLSLASVEANDRFFAEHWPDAAVISDPDKVLFAGLGKRRGSLLQLFGPKVFGAAWRAWWKGHRIGRPAGDPTVMPGVMVVDGSRVLWEHPFRNVGDHPEVERIPRLAGLIAG